MSGGTPAEAGEGLWARIARLVTTHPGRVLAGALLVVVLPALALPTVRISHDTLEQLPDDAESVRGFEALAEHFPPGELSPLMVVVDDEQGVLRPASLRALADLSRNLRRMESVATVRSVAMPTNGRLPAELRGDGGLQRVNAFSDRLQQATGGAGQLEDGLEQLVSGLEQIQQQLPQLSGGLSEARSGIDRLRDAVGRARQGVRRLREGVDELRSGLVEVRDGATRLRRDVAVPAEESVRAAWRTLSGDFTLGRADPAYADALRQVGRVYGRITGEDPRTGEQIRDSYQGLPEALAGVASGLSDAIGGTGRLADGLVELDRGLGRLADGVARLDRGLTEAGPGVERLADGVDRLLSGARRLRGGAAELRAGLSDGAARLEQANLRALLPSAEDSGPFVITPGILDARPQVRDQLGLFLAEEGTRTRLFVGLSHDPFSLQAVEAVDRVRDVAELSVQSSPLEDATIRPTGVSAFFDDVGEASSSDLPLIVGAVVLGVFLVLALLLRSLVAPVYMVATVLLSFASALGATALVFQGLVGDSGLVWWLPPFLFVLLVALGADYNIYLMGRVREEARDKPTLTAVADATRATGGVITSAGLILAGTFAALMAARMGSLVQMGFAVTVGILLDTFVVRSLLVPSIAALLGRHNWWPSRRAAPAAEDGRS